MGLSEHGTRAAIADFVARAAGARHATVLELEALPGGTIQENYRLELEITGGKFAGRQSLVLRTDSPSPVPVSLSRAQEFAVLTVAFAAGVTVAEPLWLCEDDTITGKAFHIMRRVSGSASAHALVRAPLAEQAREALVARLGGELARLHRIKPPVEALALLPIAHPPAALARVAHYRKYLDALAKPQPVLEWGLRWLELHAPSSDGPVLCHGDYRTGNYMVDDAELTGILDWEFASWSDAYEDLSWFCARCWRFGAWDQEAGGIGSRGAFYRGYQEVAGHEVDHARVAYWEVMAAVRWAIIALQQAERHLSGAQSSLELALTGRMVPEMAHDMLVQIDQLEAPGGAHA
ncbi:MAG: phosphotransferase family protein [Gammaproteobacteria bacterium]|nr:MAG: phosphotransferase family protein [Gammaproteobacteria bacterium]